jgi:hypothetical protein
MSKLIGFRYSLFVERFSLLDRYGGSWSAAAWTRSWYDVPVAVAQETAIDAAAAAPPTRPRLLVFNSRICGACRRTEAHLAQVLQRRQNHRTFHVCSISREERPDLFERFRVSEVPTLLVVDGGRVRARIEHPRGPSAIRASLAHWLR